MLQCFNFVVGTATEGRRRNNVEKHGGRPATTAREWLQFQGPNRDHTSGKHLLYLKSFSPAESLRPHHECLGVSQVIQDLQIVRTRGPTENTDHELSFSSAAPSSDNGLLIQVRANCSTPIHRLNPCRSLESTCHWSDVAVF